MLHLLFLAIVSAQDHLTPTQRQILAEPAPAPAEYRFSFEAPGRPTFTDAQKEEQRARGRGLLAMITAAYEQGAAEVRVPPGDYRLPPPPGEPGRRPWFLSLEKLQRPPEKPFVIDMTGVTLWFDFSDAQMPPGQLGVRIRDCRNLVLRGATLDRSTPGQIECRITRIDRAGNRFEIQPSKGVVIPTSFNEHDEQRLLPFKSDGRFCAPLYDLQPGIRRLRYQSITPSGDGRYWVTMRERDLIERIHDPEWLAAHGDLGSLAVGDGLSCLYTGAQAILIEHSANVTIHRVNIYIAKGGCTEVGGDGAHLWKDCFLGPRPGTDQWKGADGYLFRATRWGTTLDNVTLRTTADDLANFHGIWGKVATVQGHDVTFARSFDLRQILEQMRPGDHARFIHRENGAFLGEARVTAVREFSVTLDRPAAPFAGAMASWPEHECAGWTVQNCRWEDCFQRLLVMSGPGTVRNNRFSRWGSSIDLNTGMGFVGGVPSGITITGNTFTDVSPRFRSGAIYARAHDAKGRDGVPPIEDLVITDNTFQQASPRALSLTGVKGAVVRNNTFLLGSGTLGEAVVLQTADAPQVEGNTVRKR